MKKQRLLVAVAVLALLASAPVPVVAALVDPPTVDGCFYSSQACGDDHKWPLLAEALGGRGKLYGLTDGSTLYLAVEVDSDVNDNVFGTKAEDGPYMTSAGWSAVHSANRLMLSDNAQMEVRCGPNTWNWYNGYIYDADGDEDPADNDWLSGPGDNSIGGGTPPPGLVSATTLQRNLNTSSWDVTLGGTRSSSDDWKSPDGGTIGDVTDDGWPTYNSAYDWEWAIVHEMSMDVSSCGANAITVQVISAHNSPSKDGDQDVPIELTDWGDLPDPTYPTLLANNGARHFLPVGGQSPYLGQTVDQDPDGQPSAGAVGDDNDADGGDEDGVTAGGDWNDGQAELDVSVSGGDGCLNAWLDFTDGSAILHDGDGDVDDTYTELGTAYPEHVLVNLPIEIGSHQLTFALPVGATEAAGGASWYMRVRLTPRDTDGGCDSAEAYVGGAASPSGAVDGGEVEDHAFSFTPTAVTLTGLEAQPSVSWPVGVGLAALALLALVAGAFLLRRLSMTKVVP